MRILKLLLASFMIFSLGYSCGAQSEKGGNTVVNTKSPKVEVYYFHYTHRCVTCRTVESESKRIVGKLYGKKVSFTALNLDEPDGSKKGKALDVSGQTLLIICGNKKINLTTEGFMYAVNNPDKLEKIIKENIDPLL